MRLGNHRPLRSMTALAVALLFLALSAISVPGATPTPEDNAAYRKALWETEDISQQDVSTKLLAIVPGDDRINFSILHGYDIAWEGDPYFSRVRVVAFMGRDTYNRFFKPHIGEESYTLTRALWVTVVPELKNFFIGRTCPPTAKRVKQLLGLHPMKDYDALVEMFVEPGDLFRPAADPQVTNHDSQLAYKIDKDDWIFPSDRNPFLNLPPSRKMVEKQNGSPATFKQWYVNRAQTIYGDADPTNPNLYPWTRLGCTYDWGRPKVHTGLSEFVVWLDPSRNGGQVTVKLGNGIDSKTPEWNKHFRCVAENASQYAPVPVFPQSPN